VRLQGARHSPQRMNEGQFGLNYSQSSRFFPHCEMVVESWPKFEACSVLP
jgi:hypothetical protein